MKRLTLLGVALGLVACHATPQTASAPSKRVLGTFAYTANLGQRNEVGTFTIEADTVTVDADHATCRRLFRLELVERIHDFDCVGVEGTRSLTLTIDSNRPTQSKWYATHTVTRARQVCTQWATKPTGETFCVSYRTETYDDVAATFGPLRVVAVKSNQ